MAHLLNTSASEKLGSWLAASLPYEAMTLQAAFLHEGTSRNWFRTGFRGSVTKQIFNYSTNFSLEITSKVQKVNHKYTFTHKLTTKHNFQTPSLFFSLTVTEWNTQDCGISKAAKDTSMLPSKIDQMKVSHETGSEANFGFGRALMPSYLGMLLPKAAFFSFRMQPLCAVSWLGNVSFQAQSKLIYLSLSI